MATILITTADLQAATRLQIAFARRPEDEAILVAGPREAAAAVEGKDEEDVAVVLTGDLQAEGSRRIVQALSQDGPRPGVLALVFDGEVAGADVALELGIDETLTKPADPEEVVLVVHRLLERRRLQRGTGIVGQSEAVREVLERVAQIAPVGSTVLITGESGTGKELVARALHHLSPRRGRPFIAINCAAVPETLLESELFGHEKGAFTGASSLRKGMFELANAGTILLDEISEMPWATQTKLLRVLEQREFMRVGGERPIHVDVRVIAATNRLLKESVALGEFRRDLYYRLAVLHIHLPPLRERREDVALLVREFIRQFSREYGREFRGIAPEALDMLVRYDWPGNIRELRNLIESMVVLAPGSVIRPEDIPTEVRGGTTRRATLATTAPLVPRRAAEVTPPPEMEFIFRTLVELKLDVEDLRREFEEYKRRHPELLDRAREPAEAGRPAWVEAPAEAEPVEPAAPWEGREVAEVAAVAAESDASGDPGIRFQPGMRMEELERAAIIATLRAVGGNRRKAAEALGIGERTLYRKLKEYDIQA
ncbi:MAG: sigma-54-dependent Fis family transcriptional regulator [Gemmatimonadetes bacterium]|nr:sigma-54-dependent Fis family transcriptional regulator [Gemmatimonadota bacterium]